jgi:phage baseplate assembly protein gpV
MSFTPEERREIAAIVAARIGANHRGIIASYQPEPPMVKVQIMPAPPASDGPTPETGWIPYKSWATGVIGNGWRVVAPPQAGQQVLLICEEGDAQNYTAWGGYYSDVDTAPQGAEAGEILFENETGAQVYLKAGGAISLITPTLTIAAPGGGDTTVNITGSLNVSTETTTDGIAFTPHTHQYMPGGNPPMETGTPQG